MFVKKYAVLLVAVVVFTLSFLAINSVQATQHNEPFANSAWVGYWWNDRGESLGDDKHRESELHINFDPNTGMGTGWWDKDNFQIAANPPMRVQGDVIRWYHRTTDGTIYTVSGEISSATGVLFVHYEVRDRNNKYVTSGDGRYYRR